MAFLTIYTPTYKRPKALAVCVESVLTQHKGWHVQHLIVPDEVGLGIDGMYADIINHVDEVNGEYVFMLSDDDMLCNDKFVSNLLDFTKDNEKPEVIIIKAIKEGRILPSIWNAKPQLGHIDISCFVVRSDIWKVNADKWGKRYEGDFDFINSLWEQGYQFNWMDVVAVKAQRISRGQPE